MQSNFKYRLKCSLSPRPLHSHRRDKVNWLLGPGREWGTPYRDLKTGALDGGCGNIIVTIWQGKMWCWKVKIEPTPPPPPCSRCGFNLGLYTDGYYVLLDRFSCRPLHIIKVVHNSRFSSEAREICPNWFFNNRNPEPICAHTRILIKQCALL